MPDFIQDGGRSCNDPAQRAERLRQDLQVTARIILPALAMDAIYSFIVFRPFYPLEVLWRQERQASHTSEAPEQDRWKQ